MDYENKTATSTHACRACRQLLPTRYCPSCRYSIGPMCCQGDCCSKCSSKCTQCIACNECGAELEAAGCCETASSRPVCCKMTVGCTCHDSDDVLIDTKKKKSPGVLCMYKRANCDKTTRLRMQYINAVKGILHHQSRQNRDVAKTNKSIATTLHRDLVRGNPYWQSPPTSQNRLEFEDDTSTTSIAWDMRNTGVVDPVCAQTVADNIPTLSFTPLTSSVSWNVLWAQASVREMVLQEINQHLPHTLKCPTPRCIQLEQAISSASSIQQQLGVSSSEVRNNEFMVRMSRVDINILHYNSTGADYVVLATPPIMTPAMTSRIEHMLLYALCNVLATSSSTTTHTKPHKPFTTQAQAILEQSLIQAAKDHSAQNGDGDTRGQDYDATKLLRWAMHVACRVLARGVRERCAPSMTTSADITEATVRAAITLETSATCALYVRDLLMLSMCSEWSTTAQHNTYVPGGPLHGAPSMTVTDRNAQPYTHCAYDSGRVCDCIQEHLSKSLGLSTIDCFSKATSLAGEVLFPKLFARIRACRRRKALHSQKNASSASLQVECNTLLSLLDKMHTKTTLAGLVAVDLTVGDDLSSSLIAVDDFTHWVGTNLRRLMITHSHAEKREKVLRMLELVSVRRRLLEIGSKNGHIKRDHRDKLRKTKEWPEWARNEDALKCTSRHLDELVSRNDGSWYDMITTQDILSVITLGHVAELRKFLTESDGTVGVHDVESRFEHLSARVLSPRGNNMFYKRAKNKHHPASGPRPCHQHIDAPTSFSEPVLLRSRGRGRSRSGG